MSKILNKNNMLAINHHLTLFEKDYLKMEEKDLL